MESPFGVANLLNEAQLFVGDPGDVERNLLAQYDAVTPSGVFEQAWADRSIRCPQCHNGTSEARGTTSFDHRRWVRFSCGDVISVEQTAG